MEFGMDRIRETFGQLDTHLNCGESKPRCCRLLRLLCSDKFWRAFLFLKQERKICSEKLLVSLCGENAGLMCCLAKFVNHSKKEEERIPFVCHCHPVSLSVRFKEHHLRYTPWLQAEVTSLCRLPLDVYLLQELQHVMTLKSLFYQADQSYLTRVRNRRVQGIGGWFGSLKPITIPRWALHDGFCAFQLMVRALMVLHLLLIDTTSIVFIVWVVSAHCSGGLGLQGVACFLVLTDGS